MVFFRKALEDGLIDDKINHDELQNAMLSMLQDSNAWQKHSQRHREASLVKIEDEPTEFEKSVKAEHPSEQFFNYDSGTKHFTAQCNCGERFELDIRNQEVSPGKSNDAVLAGYAQRMTSYASTPDDGDKPQYSGPKQQTNNSGYQGNPGKSNYN